MPERLIYRPRQVVCSTLSGRFHLSCMWLDETLIGNHLYYQTRDRAVGSFSSGYSRAIKKARHKAGFLVIPMSYLID